MSRIFPYKNTGMPKLSAYQCACFDARQPCLTALTRRTTAYIELDMLYTELTTVEQAIIYALFAEHATRRPYAVTSLVAYCQHLRRDALPLVMRRIEQILALKAGEVQR